MKNKQITVAERGQIEAMLKLNCTPKQIAVELGRTYYSPRLFLASMLRARILKRGIKSGLTQSYKNQ